MEKTLNVQVKRNLPDYLAVQEFEGEILEVTDTGDGFYTPTDAQFLKLMDRGARNCYHFTIAKNEATVLEENPFELKSGMTFLDNQGRSGLMVATDKGLIPLFGNGKGNFYSYGKEANEYLAPNPPKYTTYFVEVFDGMNSNPAASLSGNDNGKSLWKRVEEKKVILNSDHVAVVTKDSVTVGGQVIPMSAVREIVEAADKM